MFFTTTVTGSQGEKAEVVMGGMPPLPPFGLTEGLMVVIEMHLHGWPSAPVPPTEKGTRRARLPSAYGGNG